VAPSLDRSAVARRLAAAGCIAADREADELFGAAPDVRTLEVWIGRREDGEPLAWIVGRATFCGRTIRIDPGVYVPRPQTEDLARKAARLLPAAGRAIDLCCGSGAVAAHLRAARPDATVIGVDLDPLAAACALGNRVPAVVGDVDAPLRAERTIDVVTAVPPYVPEPELAFLPSDVRRHEPRRALDGGADGVDVVRRVIAGAGRLLRPGGWLLIELGGRQDGLVAGDLSAAGFEAPIAWRDVEGDLRGVVAQRRATRGSMLD
jgi:release factor glutamine methyltransferase